MTYQYYLFTALIVGSYLDNLQRRNDGRKCCGVLDADKVRIGVYDGNMTTFSHDVNIIHEKRLK